VSRLSLCLETSSLSLASNVAHTHTLTAQNITSRFSVVTIPYLVSIRSRLTGIPVRYDVITCDKYDLSKNVYAYVTNTNILRDLWFSQRCRRKLKSSAMLWPCRLVDSLPMFRWNEIYSFSGYISFRYLSLNNYAVPFFLIAKGNHSPTNNAWLERLL
jgi:hypothetical protein